MSTSDNLKTAFAGESQANRKYSAYAEKADKDGHPAVARLFRAIAAAEAIHAKNHFKAQNGVKSTLENLTDAQAGENYEVTEMYPPMIAAAETEGEKAAARSMRYAFEVEKVHYELYGQAIEAVKAGKDLADLKIRVCPICGHTVIGDAPDACPVCGCKGSLYQDIA
jgi:rubrerythrin